MQNHTCGWCGKIEYYNSNSDWRVRGFDGYDFCSNRCIEDYKAAKAQREYLEERHNDNEELENERLNERLKEDQRRQSEEAVKREQRMAKSPEEIARGWKQYDLKIELIKNKIITRYGSIDNYLDNRNKQLNDLLKKK